jgi:hypothetical protein
VPVPPARCRAVTAGTMGPVYLVDDSCSLSGDGRRNGSCLAAACPKEQTQAP